MNERDEKQPTISQTLHAVHAAADMLLAGKEIALDYLKEYPYYPPAEEFATRIWQESGVDFFSLTGGQRKQISENAREIYLAMTKRAEVQREFYANPQAFGKKILDLFEKTTYGRVKLNLENVGFAWSLFSFSLVLSKEDYEKVETASRRTPGTSRGWISHIEGPLGRIPIVRESEEIIVPFDKIEYTILHEDFHIFQGTRGELIGEADVGEKLLTDEMLRLAGINPDDKEIMASDLDAGLEYLNWLVSTAKQDFEIESRAYPWSGGLYRRLPEQLSGAMDMALALINNALYAKANTLPPEEKIRIAFESALKVAEAKLPPVLMILYLDKLTNNYKNEGVPFFDWIASRLAVIPVGSSLSLIKQVLLGRHAKMEVEDLINYSYILAEVMVNHAFKSVHPELWTLLPREISKENLEAYLKIVIDVYQDRGLYSSLLEESSDENSYLHLRERVIDTAVEHVPKGGKRKAKRVLIKSLPK